MKKALLTIDPAVQELFPLNGGISSKTVAQVVSDAVSKLQNKTKERIYSDRIILAGSERHGFMDVTDVRLEGIVPYFDWNRFSYNTLDLSLRGSEMLVLAQDDVSASLCREQLTQAGYKINEI